VAARKKDQNNSVKDTAGKMAVKVNNVDWQADAEI